MSDFTSLIEDSPFSAAIEDSPFSSAIQDSPFGGGGEPIFVSGGLFDSINVQLHRVVRPNVIRAYFANLPIAVPPPPRVPNAHARWGRASDFSLTLEKDDSAAATSYDGGTRPKESRKKRKEKKEKGKYKFDEQNRKVSYIQVKSDDGDCSVTFERIEEVTFSGPGGVLYTFVFHNPNA